ncbi:hypothetical protein F8S13_23305 [Chloroflexia bacterium SDU3-3]|nr:hypothetical protein F8S13_23305 [Chloroflexia bacterium SDU3-3]
MPRYLPSVPYTCSICHTAFPLRTWFEPARPGVVQMPDSCPACGAPIRSRADLTVGTAKDLILTHYQLPTYKKLYADARGFFVKQCLTEKDIDTLEALVHDLDMAAWAAADSQEKASQKLSREDKQETSLIKRAAEEHKAGTLQQELRAAADQARAALRREREQHMRVFEQRAQR